MRVRVTADHIRRGRRQSCDLCPIALALAEQTKDHVDVGTSNVWIGSRPIPLPPAASRFVREFDAGMTVEPVEFDLNT